MTPTRYGLFLETTKTAPELPDDPEERKAAREARLRLFSTIYAFRIENAVRRMINGG